jgi:hypothetical protein
MTKARKPRIPSNTIACGKLTTPPPGVEPGAYGFEIPHRDRPGGMGSYYTWKNIRAQGVDIWIFNAI